MPTKYIYLSGPVVSGGFYGTDAATLRNRIAAIRTEDASSPITLIVNSEGGDVYEGVAIYNLLRAEHVDVIVSGMAASIASVIAMAGEHVSMYANSLMYVHHAWTCGDGNADQLQQQVDQLRDADRILIDAYKVKSGRTEEEIAALLDGPNGDGSSLTAERALELGLIDEVLDPAQAIAARLTYAHTFANMTSPNNPTNQTKEPQMDPTKEDPAVTAPEAACGEPEKAEEVVEVEKEIEKKEETPEVDPREVKIEELEKKVEELTAKVASMTEQLEAQAKYRVVVASAHQTKKADAEKPMTWPEALRKHGYVDACAMFPELRSSYIAEVTAKTR